MFSPIENMDFKIEDPTKIQKAQNHYIYVFIAIILGVFALVFLTIMFRGIKAILKFVGQNYVWFIIVFLAIIILRKRRRK